MVKHGKETIDVVRAAMALAQRDVDLGICDLDEILAIPRTRFAPVERARIAKALIESGASERQAAKTLKVSKTTVRQDLGKSGRGRKATANGRKATAKSDPIAAGKAEHSKTTFLHRADLAVTYAVYDGKIDKETCRAARAAALAWNTLATQMEESNG
jgi:hypothetical protein